MATLKELVLRTSNTADSSVEAALPLASTVSISELTDTKIASESLTTKTDHFDLEEYRRNSPKHFDELLRRVKVNDPTLKTVSTENIAYNDEMINTLLDGLESNIHFERLEIRAKVCSDSITDKTAKRIESLVTKNDRIYQLLLCGNMITREGAEDLIRMIQSVSHLASFCVCTTPCVEDCDIAERLCDAIENNRFLFENMQTSKFYRSLDRFKLPKIPLSRLALTTWIVNDPRKFNELFCASTEGPRMIPYSKLTECDCRAETARLINFVDHRKLVENFVVEYIQKTVQDKFTPVKILSIGTANLLSEAIMLLKLSKHFKYLKLFAVDLTYDNIPLLVTKKQEDFKIETLMHFMKLMHDLDIEVINGSLSTDSRVPQQDIAFHLFRRQVPRLKNPRGYLELSLYSNVKSYRLAMNAGTQTPPHVMLTIDLDMWPNEESRLSQIKADLPPGTLHVSLEKFASDRQYLSVYLDHLTNHVSALAGEVDLATAPHPFQINENAIIGDIFHDMIHIKIQRKIASTGADNALASWVDYSDADRFTMHVTPVNMTVPLSTVIKEYGDARHNPLLFSKINVPKSKPAPNLVNRKHNNNEDRKIKSEISKQRRKSF